MFSAVLLIISHRSGDDGGPSVGGAEEGKKDGFRLFLFSAFGLVVFYCHLAFRFSFICFFKSLCIFILISFGLMMRERFSFACSQAIVYLVS